MSEELKVPLNIVKNPPYYEQEDYFDDSDNIHIQINSSSKYEKDQMNNMTTPPSKEENLKQLKITTATTKYDQYQNSLQHPQLQNLLYSPPSSPNSNTFRFHINKHASSPNNQSNRGKKVKGLNLSAQTHKESADFTSDSGTFQMKKSEFSSRKLFGLGGGGGGGQSIISKMFSFKRGDGDNALIKTTKHGNTKLFRGPLSVTYNQSRGKSGSRFSKRQFDGYQNSYTQQDYEGVFNNYVLLSEKSKKIESGRNISNNQNAAKQYVNSFNNNFHNSTVLSQTKDGEYYQHANTPGQIKHSMKALQSSVSALLERAYLHQTTMNTHNPNYQAANGGVIQYPSIAQIQKLHQHQQQQNQNKWNESSTQGGVQNTNDLQTKHTDENTGQLQNYQYQQHQQYNTQERDARTSHQDSTLGIGLQPISITSPPLLGRTTRNNNKRFNQSNRNTREVKSDHRLSKFNMTEAKNNEDYVEEDTTSPVNTRGNNNRMNSNYNGKHLMSQYGYDIDETQLNKEQIKLFALLQEPHNEEELQTLLDTMPYQTLINLHNTTGYSVLHVATCNNNSNYTQILISHLLVSSKEIDNDSVQREDDDNETTQNLFDEKYLIEKHLNLSHRARMVVEKWINQLTLGTDEQFAAIHFAAFNGNLKIMQMLKRFGGDIKQGNNQGINCMHFAAQGNQPKILHYLIQKHQFNIDDMDYNGCTPLHWACVSGSYQSVRYLLAEGADPNIQQLNELLTPLHMTIKYIDETREIRTIHKLLIYGAYIDLQDENKMTATEYVEHIEDDDLREQCVSLINDVAFKNNGLFPCVNRCKKVNRSLKKVRQRKFFILLFFGMVLQVFLLMFYINPVIEIFDGQDITEIFIQAIQGSFNFLIITSLLYLWRSDPGFICQNLQQAQSLKGVQISTITYDQIIEDVDFKQICPECKIIMTKRSRHCYGCKRCVERFDHHCDWIDNCVGIKNHSMFMMFIVTLLLYMIFTICLAVDQIVFKFGVGDATHTNFFAILPRAIYFVGVAQFLMGLLGLLCLIFLVPLGSLVFLQLRNLFQNLTTYERFSKGIQKQNASSTNGTQQTTQTLQNNNQNSGSTQENDQNIHNIGIDGGLLLQNHDQEAVQAEKMIRMTEDSDEIEALKNNKEYAVLVKNSRSQQNNKSSSNEYQRLMLTDPMGLSNNFADRDVNNHQNLQQHNPHHHDSVTSSRLQDNDDISSDQSITLHEKDLMEFNHQNSSSQDLENPHNKPKDLYTLPFDDQKQLIDIKDNTSQYQQQENVFVNNNMSISNIAKQKGLGKKERRRKWNYLSNFRVMCCQTDIKSQSELYYEHMHRQRRKNDLIIQGSRSSGQQQIVEAV